MKYKNCSNYINVEIQNLKRGFYSMKLCVLDNNGNLSEYDIEIEPELVVRITDGGNNSFMMSPRQSQLVIKEDHLTLTMAANGVLGIIAPGGSTLYLSDTISKNVNINSYTM